MWNFFIEIIDFIKVKFVGLKVKFVGLKINFINRVSIFVLKIMLYLNFVEKGIIIKFGILLKIDLFDLIRLNLEIIVKMMNVFVKIYMVLFGLILYGFVLLIEGKIDWLMFEIVLLVVIVVSWLGKMCKCYCWGWIVVFSFLV